MRSTVTIDSELLAKAQEMSGIKGTSPVIHAALTVLIQREAAKRLARLGGSDPKAKAPPRRRFK